MHILLWMNLLLGFICMSVAEQWGAGKNEKFKMRIYFSNGMRTTNLRTAVKGYPYYICSFLQLSKIML